MRRERAGLESLQKNPGIISLTARITPNDANANDILETDRFCCAAQLADFIENIAVALLKV